MICYNPVNGLREQLFPIEFPGIYHKSVDFIFAEKKYGIDSSSCEIFLFAGTKILQETFENFCW
jgi:hypothetical protein